MPMSSLGTSSSITKHSLGMTVTGQLQLVSCGDE